MDFNAPERRSGFGLSDIGFKLSGKKAVVQSEIIGGRKVNVVFTFYNTASFKADILEWMEYQRKIYAKREQKQQVEGFKRYKIPGSTLDYYEAYELLQKKVTYEEFQHIAFPTISRIIFQAFADHPEFFNDRSEITVQLQVRRAPRWEQVNAKNYSFSGAFPESPVEDYVEPIKEGLVDLDHYYLLFSGLYILESIVAPHIISNRIDYNFMYTYIVHELGHWHSLALKYYEKETYLTKKLTPYMKTKSDYSLSYLYLAIADLKSEGLADFRKKMYSNRILIKPDWIRNFRNLLAKIPKIKDQAALDDYYGKHIYADTFEGVYHCGYVMCVIIAYSMELPKYLNAARIMFEGIVAPANPLLPESDLHAKPFTPDNLRFAFKTQRQFFVTPPSPDAYKATFEAINSLDPVTFIKRYEQACLKLGLGQDQMAISYEIFEKLWKEAEKAYDKRELAKIRKAGYYPIE
jgi:hypothetical protein